jgi:hypothetical protein
LDIIPDVSEIITETLEKTVDIPIISETISALDDDYTLYMYMGLAILVLLAFFAYKFYNAKQKRVTFQDKLEECYGVNECYDGVCQRV